MIFSTEWPLISDHSDVLNLTKYEYATFLQRTLKPETNRPAIELDTRDEHEVVSNAKHGISLQSKEWDLRFLIKLTSND